MPESGEHHSYVLPPGSYAFARTWWQHVERLDLQPESLEVTEHAIDRAEMVMNDDQERGLREEDAIKQTGLPAITRPT